MAGKTTLERYEALVEKAPGVELKGKANRYTSMNGNMFSFVTKEGKIALRLPEARRVVLAKKHGTKPCIQHGSVMRGYAELPIALLSNTRLLNKLFRESVEYAATLPAKATKRKPAKKPAKKKAAKKAPAKKKRPTKKATAKKRASTKKKSR